MYCDVPQLVRQSVAESLHTYLSTNQLVTDLVTYLKRLGLQGVGLVEATERSPIIGHIIGTPCGPSLSRANLASQIPGCVLQIEVVAAWQSRKQHANPAGIKNMA